MLESSCVGVCAKCARLAAPAWPSVAVGAPYYCL